MYNSMRYSQFPRQLLIEISIKMKGTNSSIVTFISLLIIVCFNNGLVEGIQGGQPVPDGEYTYHVSVLIHGQMACGGAIAGPKHVLSSGQCVVDLLGYFLNVKIEILAGVNYLESRAFIVRRIKVEYVYIKFDFRSPNRTYTNYPESGDIALLVLAEELPLGPNSVLKKITFPTKSRGGAYKQFTHNTAIITGFGQTSGYAYQSASNISDLEFRRNSWKRLNYITTFILRHHRAIQTYPQFQDSHLAASSLTQDTNPAGVCKGDIGGPLVLENNCLVGILQIHTENCNDKDRPAVYTRVSSFIDFINRALGGHYDDNMRLANYTGENVYEIPHPLRAG